MKFDKTPNHWTREEEARLFEYAKVKATIEQLEVAFPKRTKQQIIAKSRRQGFRFIKGTLRL